MQATMSQRANARGQIAGRSAIRRSLTAGRVMCVARPKNGQPQVQPVAETVAPGWLVPALAAAPMLLAADPAMAVDGAYGILEGRTVALLHPIIMAGLFGATVYAGYLGWQWRRTRELGDEIRALRAAAPAATAEAPAPPNPALEAKEAERKALLAGGFKDKHFAMGSLLLGSGVVFAIEGCVNTYMRTGKLFPGPHLYAGAGIVALWALAAALVPAMQKGDNNARNAHIALNAAQVGLFLWQLPTGWEIVLKVFTFVPRWF